MIVSPVSRRAFSSGFRVSSATLSCRTRHSMPQDAHLTPTSQRTHRTFPHSEHFKSLDRSIILSLLSMSFTHIRNGAAPASGPPSVSDPDLTIRRHQTHDRTGSLQPRYVSGDGLENINMVADFQVHRSNLPGFEIEQDLICLQADLGPGFEFRRRRVPAVTHKPDFRKNAAEKKRVRHAARDLPCRHSLPFRTIRIFGSIGS